MINTERIFISTVSSSVKEQKLLFTEKMLMSILSAKRKLERQSVNINRHTQSTSFSTQLDYLVPEGKIATLPQGYMVGQVADNFGETVGQKNFNCLIQVDVTAQSREEGRYVPIPDFYSFDNIPEVLERNRIRIQNDIRSIVQQKQEGGQSKPIQNQP